MSNNFSSETVEAKRQWNTFKELKGEKTKLNLKSIPNKNILHIRSQNKNMSR